MRSSIVELSTREIKEISGRGEIFGAAILVVGYATIAIGSYFYSRYIKQFNKKKEI